MEFGRHGRPVGPVVGALDLQGVVPGREEGVLGHAQGRRIDFLPFLVEVLQPVAVGTAGGVGVVEVGERDGKRALVVAQMDGLARDGIHLPAARLHLGDIGSDILAAEEQLIRFHQADSRRPAHPDAAGVVGNDGIGRKDPDIDTVVPVIGSGGERISLLRFRDPHPEDMVEGGGPDIAEKVFRETDDRRPDDAFLLARDEQPVVPGIPDEPPAVGRHLVSFPPEGRKRGDVPGKIVAEASVVAGGEDLGGGRLAEAEEVHNDKKEIENLMEQVKHLENENQQLHENILKLGNKKQKKSLEYYVRLKKDLLDEEKKLNHQLTKLEMHKDLESKEISSQKEFLKKKIDETNKENKSLKEKIDSHNKALEKKSKTLSKRKVELKNELDEKKIDELESKVISLTNDLNSKEAIVQEQKDKIDELQMKIDSISQNMTEQINDIRSQYENVYSASKQNEENFNKLYEDKTNNMKDNIQSNKYQLEKKLVHTKNCLNNIENENNVLSKVYEYDLQNKENEINNLKENYERINNIYTEFSKLCGGNLDKLKNNLKQMKEIYLERENEMVNMSKLYVNSMNGYGTSLKEAKNNKISIASDSSENAGLIQKLEERKKILEDEVNELRNIKEELVGERITDIKAKISIMNENVNHLNEKQNEFSSKIRRVNEFTNTINRSSTIFNTLQQNIKNYQKKNENLEKKLTKMNIGGEKELNELKEKLQKLEQEKNEKEESIAKYDKMFNDVIESINNQDEVRTDVLKRLNDQITSYKAQIDKLLESKDNMQTYYMDEVKRLNEKVAFLTSENAELKTDNENLKKEKKSTKGDSDLCNQEYNQFKDAFYAMSDIENMIGEFNKSSEEVKNIRDYLLADELIKTKEDIKLKNKEIKVLKEALNETNIGKSNRSSVKSSVTNNLAKKKNNNSDFAEMSKNIKTKLKLYTVLVNKKSKEVEGLENHIKLLKDYNNFSKKCGENQELLCEENKIMTDELINDFSGLNQFEEELKNEIQFLEQKLKTNEESHSNSIQILNNNVNQQLNAIKDRENYIIKQSEQITNGLKKVANQKQNAVDILKIENQQLKDRNYIINTKL